MSTGSPIIPPVKREILVAAGQAKAFQAWTTHHDAWYPRRHHIGKSPMKQAVLECKPGGRWYEIGEDGAECEWGKVLIWEPPRRLILAWQVNGQWQYDPGFVTEVEVNFIPKEGGKTLVTLEHRNLGRFGDVAEEIRKSIGADEGWGAFMTAFKEYVEK
jgi:uncharacterized protein YndB with AHSA1/START domain